MPAAVSAACPPGAARCAQLPRMRPRSIASPAKAAAAVAAAQLAIALPFLVVSPTTVRGVPGPLLIVISMAASYLLGVRWGLPLTILGITLAVTVIGENAVAAPLVWIPASIAAGLLGDSVRRGQRLRRSLVTQLRAGLVALSKDRTVGPVTVISRYLPAEEEQLLAGDFYGVVRSADGRVELMVGDVSGHGPEAAAVATHLRAGWRALAVAGIGHAGMLQVLNDAMLSEQRASGGTRFATVCLASVDADLSSARVSVAGHPTPILATAAGASELLVRRGPPIGVVDAYAWEPSEMPLPDEAWTLLLYTDGLIEGRSAPGGPRPFGGERLCQLIAQAPPPLVEPQVDTLLTQVREANGGPMTDDVVVLAVSPAAATDGLPVS
jgi:Stage II sporulation protein E (SpoIIE)